jgi:hypothetical protein
MVSETEQEVVMRTNYVMIDFENVQPESLAGLQGDHFKVMVFVGANQGSIPFAIVDAMQALCGRAEYIKISGHGKNALDFHIAYYIGLIAAKDPTAFFHIISQDTGFDPLIAHLKTKKIMVVREASINEIPLIKAPQPVTPQVPVAPAPIAPVKKPDDRFAGILQNLRLLKASKPRTVKTLTSHIKTMYPNAITDGEIATFIAELRSKKYISVTENRITYNV